MQNAYYIILNFAPLSLSLCVYSLIQCTAHAQTSTQINTGFFFHLASQCEINSLGLATILVCSSLMHKGVSYTFIVLFSGTSTVLPKQQHKKKNYYYGNHLKKNENGSKHRKSTIPGEFIRSRRLQLLVVVPLRFSSLALFLPLPLCLSLSRARSI